MFSGAGFSEKGPVIKKHVRGFSFGYGKTREDAISKEQEDKRHMPGPGHYFGKEPVSTFTVHSP